MSKLTDLQEIRDQLVVSMLGKELLVEDTALEQLPECLDQVVYMEEPVDWVAPSEWPDLSAAPNSCRLLVFVPSDTGCPLAFSVTSGDNYTVDWSTGVQQYASGITASTTFLPTTSGIVVNNGVLVTVTITSGTPITGLNFATVPAGYTGQTSTVLAFWINAPSCNSLVFRGTTWEHRYCKQIRLEAIGNLTTLANFCQNMAELEDIYFPDGSLANVVSLDSAFNTCHLLQTVRFPTNSLSQVTSMNQTFVGCRNLKILQFPENSLSLVTDMTSVFNGCTRLQRMYFPDNSLQSVINFSNAFASCSFLREITFGANALQNVQNMLSSFDFCRRLRRLVFPPNSLSQVTNLQSTFSGCWSLEELILPANSLSQVTTMSNAFFNNRWKTLQIPDGAFAVVTNATSAFRFCYWLESISFPANALSTVTNISTLFDGCSVLRKVEFATPACSNVTTATNVFAGSSGLTTLTNFRCPRSFSVANNNLTADALNAIYIALPTVVGQTITVTGNPGITGHDPSIATAKGWTVTQ